MWSHNIILDFLYFSGVYFYFPTIYVFIKELLISWENMIFAGNSCRDLVNSMTIIAKSRPTFVTGASSSEVPGASYARAKSRQELPKSGTHAKRRFCTDTSNRSRYYTHCVCLEETSNFHVWTNSIRGVC